jgi:hypothetical protein
MVRLKGIEPPRLSAPEPKSGASTNSATTAFLSAIEIETLKQRLAICPVRGSFSTRFAETGIKAFHSHHRGPAAPCPPVPMCQALP